MRIKDIKVEEDNGYFRLSGMCDDFELYYKFPAPIKPQERADAFVAACLVPAMASGTDIVLDDNVAVSPQLLANLDTLQDIFCQWTRYFKRELTKINIEGGSVSEARDGLTKTISFFSGGVDGHYTLKKNIDEIDLLFFSKGIDIQLTNDALFEETLAKNRQFMQSKNKSLLAIETNVRFLGHSAGGLGWSLCFGGGLSSIALAANVQKCFIASGVTYHAMYPEGSNFITDTLWSNEYTRIVHDGAEASRIEKIKEITRDPDVSDMLRVCWQDKEYNCGKCEKCLRTMVAIRALNLTVKTFPVLTDDKVNNGVKHLYISTPIDYEFLLENLAQAKLAEDKLLVRILTRAKRRYETKELVRQFDDTLLGGRMAEWKKLFHRQG